MILRIRESEFFEPDVRHYFAWYFGEAGEETAWRFQTAVTVTLARLSATPTLGRPSKFRHPALTGLRSFPVQAPFHKLLIFYRFHPEELEAWRLMHGSRDLGHRLLEPND